MRTILSLFSGVVLLTLAACTGGDDNPNNVPRTEPPTVGTQPAAAPIAVKGVGPKIEVLQSGGRILVG